VITEDGGLVDVVYDGLLRQTPWRRSGIWLIGCGAKKLASVRFPGGPE
jgi:hypothetical protein